MLMRISKKSLKQKRLVLVFWDFKKEELEGTGEPQEIEQMWVLSKD